MRLFGLLLAAAVAAGAASAAREQGTLISFWSDRGGKPGVWVMHEDGSGARLVSGRVHAKRGSWSPDGRRLVFDGPIGVREGVIMDDFDLYVSNADGSSRHRITHGPARDVLASWSPDGRLIAFTRRPTRRAKEEIWIVRPDGRRARRLTVGAGPAWSQNGTALAFSRAFGSGYAIFTAKLDGSGVTRLTTGETDDGPTDWSADGRILFSRWRLGEHGDVWTLDVTSGEERQLTHTSADDFDATWSPDGRRILFTSDRRGNKDVFVMNADGSHARPLTRGPFEDWATDWQPPVT